MFCHGETASHVNRCHSQERKNTVGETRFEHWKAESYCIGDRR